SRISSQSQLANVAAKANRAVRTSNATRGFPGVMSETIHPTLHTAIGRDQMALAIPFCWKAPRKPGEASPFVAFFFPVEEVVRGKEDQAADAGKSSTITRPNAAIPLRHAIGSSPCGVC